MLLQAVFAQIHAQLCRTLIVDGLQHLAVRDEAVATVFNPHLRRAGSLGQCAQRFDECGAAVAQIHQGDVEQQAPFAEPRAVQGLADTRAQRVARLVQGRGQATILAAQLIVQDAEQARHAGILGQLAHAQHRAVALRRILAEARRSRSIGKLAQNRRAPALQLGSPLAIGCVLDQVVEICFQRAAHALAFALDRTCAGLRRLRANHQIKSRAGTYWQTQRLLIQASRLPAVVSPQRIRKLGGVVGIADAQRAPQKFVHTARDIVHRSGRAQRGRIQVHGRWSSVHGLSPRWFTQKVEWPRGLCAVLAAIAGASSDAPRSWQSRQAGPTSARRPRGWR